MWQGSCRAHVYAWGRELVPLRDTDVTTLGKWLSNHDNMAQGCILLERALRMASPSGRQDGDIPSARSAECLGDGSQPVVTQSRPHLLPSGPSIPTLVPGRAVYDFPDWALPLRSSRRQSQMGTARNTRTSVRPMVSWVESELLSLSIPCHLNPVPLTLRHLIRNSLLFSSH